MTADDFNEKYKDYLEERFDGLEFNIPSVTEYLDKKFQELIKVPGFKYSQIKLKFNMARFYAIVHGDIADEVEEEINRLVKIYDKK